MNRNPISRFVGLFPEFFSVFVGYTINFFLSDIYYFCKIQSAKIRPAVKDDCDWIQLISASEVT